MTTSEQLAHLFNRQDVIDAWLASDACRLMKRLKTFELSRKVFEGNFADWERAIVSRHADDPQQILMLGENRSWVEDYLVELTRTFHNLAASAFTLVDHSRKFYNELYEPGNLIPDYQQRVEDTFVTPAVPHVVKGIRNYVQHKSLPLVNVSFGLNFTQERGQTSWSVELNTARLLDEFDWPAKARSFIEQSAPRLNLAEVMQEYRDLVIAFQDWFAKKQRDVHASAFAIKESVNKRLEELTGKTEVVADAGVQVSDETKPNE